MAISHLCGFEMASWAEGNNAAANTMASATTPVHSTGHSARIQSVNSMDIGPFRTAGGTNRALFQSVRFYLQVAALPTTNPGSLYSVFIPGMNNIYVVLNTSGTIAVMGTNLHTVRATSSNTLSVDGLWHRIEIDIQSNSATSCRVYVDGTLWVTDTTNEGTRTGASTSAHLGGGVPNNPGAFDVYFDDMIFEDDTLSGGPYSADFNMLYLAAVSDNARGANWFNGTAGTTNLWDALDNVPPVGVAVTALTNQQVQNAAKDSTGNYDANCTDYTTAGIGASDTLLAVQSITNHAIEATGTALSGAVVIVSNPSGQTESTFDFGDNLAAAGTFPGTPGTQLWFTYPGPVTVSPSVTLGTQPVVRVGRRTATKTTACLADFLGIYVAYQPAAVAHSMPPQLRHTFRTLLTR